MSLTRHDLAKKLAREFTVSNGEAKELVDLIFGEISAALTDGEEVMLSNFGKFALNDSPERMGRNPRTGEPAVITARKRLSFKPARHLVTRVNGER